METGQPYTNAPKTYKKSTMGSARSPTCAFPPQPIPNPHQRLAQLVRPLIHRTISPERICRLCENEIGDACVVQQTTQFWVLDKLEIEHFLDLALRTLLAVHDKSERKMRLYPIHDNPLPVPPPIWLDFDS